MPELDLSHLDRTNVREWEALYRPRSLLRPLFSEGVVLGIVYTWAATSLEWEIVRVSFPVIDGVKHLRVRAKKREIVFQEAGITTAAAVLLLGVSLFVFLSLQEVTEIVQEVGPIGTSALGLGTLAVIGFGLFIFAGVRK